MRTGGLSAYRLDVLHIAPRRANISSVTASAAPSSLQQKSFAVGEGRQQPAGMQCAERRTRQTIFPLLALCIPSIMTALQSERRSLSKRPRGTLSTDRAIEAALLLFRGRSLCVLLSHAGGATARCAQLW